MNSREAVQYLRENHEIEVQGTTVSKWLKLGYVEGTKQENGRWQIEESSIDQAIESHNIPRKAGRPANITKKQKTQMRDMVDNKGWSPRGVAEHFGISESYVSLILRGLR